jgi:hypothetical protein
MQGEPDPYAVPKSMGIFWMLDSPKNITTTSVAQRIVANHEAYLVFLSFLPLLYLNELNVILFFVLDSLTIHAFLAIHAFLDCQLSTNLRTTTKFKKWSEKINQTSLDPC